MAQGMLKVARVKKGSNTVVLRGLGYNGIGMAVLCSTGKPCQIFRKISEWGQMASSCVLAQGATQQQQQQLPNISRIRGVW